MIIPHPNIYIASKTKHAKKWVDLRASGVNIISTWIDEAGQGDSDDLKDLCNRCIDECLSCDVLIVYREDGDYLKGAFIEMGLVLSRRVIPIYLIGPVLPNGSAFTYNKNIFTTKSLTEAIILIYCPDPNSIPPGEERNEAIEFAEWIRNNKWEYIETGLWCKYSSFSKQYNDQQLYELFKTRNQ